LSREYAVDPLEIIFAREAVRTSVVALPAGEPADHIAALVGREGSAARESKVKREQRLFPVVNDAQRLVGVVTRSRLRQWLQAPTAEPRLADIMEQHAVVAYDDEPLRAVVFRMAETGLTRLPVVSRSTGAFVGMLALTDLLMARTRILEAEQRRERILGARFLRWPPRFNRPSDV
jgi:CBS domain-containing protein